LPDRSAIAAPPAPSAAPAGRLSRLRQVRQTRLHRRSPSWALETHRQHAREVQTAMAREGRLPRRDAERNVLSRRMPEPRDERYFALRSHAMSGPPVDRATSAGGRCQSNTSAPPCGTNC
jgi:hypothetical protein